jgi:hypothetical protein
MVEFSDLEPQDSLLGTFSTQTVESAARGKRLARGVARFFTALGYSSLVEVPLPNARRADVLAIDGRGQFLLVEVKSCRADFHADNKWPEYLEFCDFFYFAVAADFPRELLPTEAGLLIADPYSAVIERDTAGRLLAPARRRALLLRFAHLAAARVQVLSDPLQPAGPRTA